MAQTIIPGFDDVWVSSADFNAVKGSANPNEYRVRQFVIRRVDDKKLFFGYQVESLYANTDSIYVGRSDSLNRLPGIIQAKNSAGGTVGTSYGRDSSLSKWDKVSGKYAIMVYPLDNYPKVNSVRYYGEYDGTKLFVGIYYNNNGSNLRGDFEISETVISSYLNAVPTPTSNVRTDKTQYMAGDTITVTFDGSTDPDGDAITYDVDIYDGVSTWIILATNKAGSPVVATVPSMVDTTAAKVRVRAKDAKGEYSSYAESATFSVSQKDGQIIAPVNVVSQAYLVSRMAPPVRLSNGWLVGTTYTTNNYYLFRSKDNGKTWELFYTSNSAAIASVAVVSKGTTLYVAAASAYTHTIRSISAIDGTPSGPVTLDAIQNSISTNSLAFAPDRTTLWWATSTKNNSLPSSFNIHAGSIPILADGTLGTPSAVSQVTTYDSTSANLADVSVVIKSDNNPLIVARLQNGASYSIISYSYDGSVWGAGRTLYINSTYAQSSPMAIRTPNGKLHVVWHGTDSADTVNNYIRYSNSTDGVTWSTPKKLWIGQNASITSDKNGKLFITYEAGGYIYRRGSVDEFATLTENVLVSTGTVPASLYDPTFQFDFTIPPAFFQTASAVKYYGAYNVNKKPAVTVTSPADNLILTEGVTFELQGSATEEDVGDVVSVFYKVNSGAAQAAVSGVSKGSSTPIPFDQTLTYRNKRIWLGSTDITGTDLAENTDHTLTIWAEDNKSGKSPEVTRKFRVVWNRPPTISGQDGDLGTFLQPPTVEYSAIDPEGNTFAFTEYLNGKQIRSFNGAAGENYTVQIDHDAWIRLDLDVQHEIRIRATDSAGTYSERVYTFTRTETHIEFVLNFDNPDVQAHFVLDGMPQRVLVTLERYIPEGATIESVKVCNNALDASPIWEDATNAVKTNRGYLFTNTTKTAANWAINIWVVIAKGSATERVKLNGFGGAFD